MDVEYQGLSCDNIVPWDDYDHAKEYYGVSKVKEAKIKISEIFSSIQGEGLYAGTPSIFLRTFGCNFECRGYGMPHGHRSTEPEDIVKNMNDSYGYEEYKDLPLVKTGCDSYASWHKDFKQFSPFMTVTEIAEKIKELLNGRLFGRNLHLILTGGEPLLGWQQNYISLIFALYEWDLVDRYDGLHITFETNGTKELTKELCAFLSDPTFVSETTFAISSKLSSSGEKFEDRFKPEAIKSYLLCRHSNKSFFKWVISNPADFYEAAEFSNKYEVAGINLPIYLMPAGAQIEMYDHNSQWLANMIVSRNIKNFRFSPRLQVSLFKNAWGT